MPATDKILIIDDDKFMHNVLCQSLAEDYDTRSAMSGKEGIDSANNWHPDVILLDVEMPGQNGYEVCDKLKNDEGTRDIPIIFVSGKSSLRERMLGYEVGADDYLVKPSSEQEIAAKILKVLSYSKVKKGLKNSANVAEKTALEAMSTSFELGKAVRFVERAYLTSSISKVGDNLMEFLADLDLAAVAMFVSRGGLHFFSSTSDVVAPLEQELIQMLHGEQRFTDFGCRTQINYSQVALLIKNMPLNDRSRYGRLKDTVPFVLGAADAKVKVIDAEQALIKQSGDLGGSIESVKTALNTVKGSFDANISAAGTIMSELLATITMDMRRLGMDTDQEEYIADKVSDSSDKLHECLAESEGTEEALSDVVILLERLAEEQNKIITESLTSKGEDYNPSDIELF